MEFWRYYEEVRRRWWAVGLMTLVAVVVVAGLLVMTPVSYVSVAKFSVRAGPGMSQVMVFPQSSSQAAYIASQELAKADIAQIVMSPTVLQRIAAHYAGNIMPGQITAMPIEGTSMLDLRASAPTPRASHELATIATAQFTKFYQQLNRADATESRKFIETQVKRAKGRLEAADDALANFKRSSGIASLPDQLSQAVSRLSSTGAALDDAEVQALAARARLAAARRALGRQAPRHIQSESFVDSPILVQMRDRLTQLQIRLNELTQLYTEQHPAVIAVRQEIATLEAQLPQAVERVVGQQVVAANPLYQQLQQDILASTEQYESAIARRNALANITTKLERRLPQLTTGERVLTRLLREQRHSESTYLLLSTKLSEALIKEQEAGYGTASLQLITAPTMPSVPVDVQAPLKLGLALFVGTLLGVGAALFLGYLDSGVRTPADAERVFGVPVLGVIPTISPRVHRQLTRVGQPGWVTASIVIGVLAAAAAFLLAARASIAGEVPTVWQLVRLAL